MYISEFVTESRENTVFTGSLGIAFRGAVGSVAAGVSGAYTGSNDCNSAGSALGGGLASI